MVARLQQQCEFSWDSGKSVLGKNVHGEKVSNSLNECNVI